MNCKNCGTVNEPGSRFCVGCGQVIESNEVSQPVVEPVMQPQMQQPVSQPVAQPTIKNNVGESVAFKDYFTLMLNGFIKPGTAIKEKLGKYNVFKNSIILASIISVIATLINLIYTMYITVKVSSYFGSETEWNFEALKELDYVQLIVKQLILYIGIIFIIASVYYVAGLIAKKQANYSKLVAISALGLVPFVAFMNILSPILGLFSTVLPAFMILIGLLYTFIFMYEGINKELKLEGDVKHYLNTACIIIILLAYAFFIGMMGLDSISTGSFDSFLSL